MSAKTSTVTARTFAVAAVSLAVCIPAAANETMNILALHGEKQTFHGFGMHESHTVPDAFRDTLSKLIITDLNITHCRFYVEGPTTDSMMSKFNETYGYPDGSSIYDDYLEQDPDLYFLFANQEQIVSAGAIPAFVSKMADILEFLRDERGFDMRWTTITNEPNDKGAHWKGMDSSKQICSIDLYPQVAKALRAELDDRGLDEIKMYGPEVSSVDNMCHQYIEALKADAEAWAAIEGFITKAYNMCADWEMKEYCEESGKMYVTAAGSNLIDYKNFDLELGVTPEDVEIEKSDDNDHFAADLAGRVFNDFNHMVTHWATYQGYYPWDPWGNMDGRFAAHRLIWFWETQEHVEQCGFDVNDMTVLGNNELYIMTTLKYYYLKQLAEQFDVGCVFRYCESDPFLPRQDMWYTFGQKPAIIASTAQNPDDSWTIGIVNLTGCESDRLGPKVGDPHPVMTYYPAATYDVTVTVQELAGTGTHDLTVVRSSKTKQIENEGTVTMEDGVATVTVGPKELVTLRGASGSSVVTQHPSTAESMKGVRTSRIGDMLTVTVPGNGEYSLRIHDAAGSLVTARNNVNSSVTLTTATWSSGIYFVTVVRDGMAKTTKRTKF
ncbi:MAG: T9SS type A sorting domain-containing protein [Chitinivibrionales bacterium]|nr:T9SS type A sorting domain-containing protein [Chitinivibrionales bacterium]MBD3396901.1 T9SS type A sorting domain-containing protein [Chitinivibrionales bacterium]